VRPVPVERREIDRLLVSIAVARKIYRILEKSEDLGHAREKVKAYIDELTEQLKDLVEEIAP